nr:acyltransferase family protein [uncultured Porphyromonas sp.]
MNTPLRRPVRASNFELLRLLAMLLVLILHANYLTFRFPTFEALHDQPLGSLGRIWSESLAIVGVNVFVLISGYFGIRFRLKGMVSLLFQAAFYTIGIYLTLVVLDLEPFQSKAFLRTFFPLDLGTEWFLPTYLSLMVFAPLLNAFVQNQSERGLRHYLIFFYVLSTLSGFLSDQFGVKDGYSLFSFIGIYLLGRYLRLHPEGVERYKTSTFVAVYLGLSFAQSLALFAYGYTSGQSIVEGRLIYKFLSYASPLNILTAVALFLAFSRLKLQSRATNWIASSTFAVYLIHCNGRLIGYYTGYIHGLSEHPVGVFLGMVAGFILLVFAGSILIDKVRLLLWEWIFSPLYDRLRLSWEKRGWPLLRLPE